MLSLTIWQLRIREFNKKKKKVVWFNKIEHQTYKLVHRVIFGKSVVRPSKNGHKIFAFHLKSQTNGNYLLSADAKNLLEAHCT